MTDEQKQRRLDAIQQRMDELYEERDSIEDSMKEFRYADARLR